MQKANNQTNLLPIVPVILCGGSGTRLWPLSRESYPKQFLPLVGEQTLFQQTLLRLDGLEQSLATKVSDSLIVTNEAHRFLVLDQLHEIQKNAEIILEPCGKNTAPSLTLAALQVVEKHENAILVVLPADQVITDNTAFNQVLQQAIKIVQQTSNTIATLGIKPTKPETGYGYIQCDSQLLTNETAGDSHRVMQFIEKPDLTTAEHYLAAGNYYWNAGIFVIKASTWLVALQQFAPAILNSTQQAWSHKQFDKPFIRPCQQAFDSIPSESIDYAVIEHCPTDDIHLQMIKLEAGWSDLGSWQAVSEQNSVDTMGNYKAGDVLMQHSQNCFVQADGRLVALVGVSDLIIVETADAVLIADKQQTQAVKNIVNQLHDAQRAELTTHRKVYRPWGWYDSIDEAERFKVKRICVKPKASLSLQKHHHRAEHWVVVKGTAEVTCGDKIMLLTENQSTYIPLGETHRLANPGNIPLEIIEIQSGGYLGEDDIVRLDDVYGRHN